jgi:hypothetical protein
MTRIPNPESSNEQNKERKAPTGRLSLNSTAPRTCNNNYFPFLSVPWQRFRGQKATGEKNLEKF